MKAHIAAKLALVKAKHSSEPRADVGFVRSCAMDMIEKRSFTVSEVSDIVRMSDDWVLSNIFQDAPGVFRVGRALRIPHSALLARLEALIAGSSQRS